MDNLKEFVNEYAGYKASLSGYNGKASEQEVKLFNNLEWMTTAEAAFYLRKSTDAIRQMVCRGQIRARKFNRRLYFKKMELDQLLDVSFY